ncbi:MAG: hypothetical protein IKC86_09730 [Prevotella sp.]|nr:hypothetical protein [Prevotella sp.]
MKIDAFPGTLTKQMVSVPFVSKAGYKGCQHIWSWTLTAEQEAWLRKWFPEEENSRLMEVSGMSASTLHMFARKYGLTKSEKGIRRIRKRQAAGIKRKLEQNGYYASMRGRRPSEACMEAVRNMWQEVRDGKREHPIHAMKHDDPKRYQQYMQRKSKVRKEAIRKEQMRVMYGLERKTNLINIVMSKYTRSQTAHRYNALRRGYFVMSDCSEHGGERYNIYYDEQTTRSEKFERNLIADGFRVIGCTEDAPTKEPTEDEE